jgi:glycosyltransferase involved in cell wall biosynthesis
MYMTCGVPVVITDVPPIAKEIAAHNAGIVVAYDKAELANAVVQILADDERLTEYRRNAGALAHKYNWVDIFSRAFSDTFAAVGELRHETDVSPA